MMMMVRLISLPSTRQYLTPLGIEFEIKLSQDEEDQAAITRARQSGWYKFGSAVVARPWVSIISILVLAGAFAYPALTFHQVGDVPCEAPYNHPVVKGVAYLPDTAALFDLGA